MTKTKIEWGETLLPPQSEAAFLESAQTQLAFKETAPLSKTAEIVAKARQAVEGQGFGSPDGGPRYAFRKTLGAGGIGQVDLVVDRDLVREVAIKKLLPKHQDNPSFLQSFLAEARVTAFLEHPNIIPLHDIGLSQEGDLYFSLKYVCGLSLEEFFAKQKGLPSAQREAALFSRLRIVLQICHAVAFAHSKGVIHRDLKPANVMLGSFGEVIVMDWGVAMPHPSMPAELREKIFCGPSAPVAGTPLYMAPEQFFGDTKVMDHRMDIYALGAILYEAITLQDAFDAGTMESLVFQKSDAALPFLAKKPLLLSSLRAIVGKALAVDPAQRYATCSDLVVDIELFLDGLTPRAEESNFLTKAGRFYLHKSPEFSKWRFLDFDLFGFACLFFGIGVAYFFKSWLFWWNSLLYIGLPGVYITLVYLRILRASAQRSLPRAVFVPEEAGEGEAERYTLGGVPPPKPPGKGFQTP